METLISFIISLAAGKTLDFIKESTSDVKKELDKAFYETIKKLYPNEYIRQRKLNSVSLYFSTELNNPYTDHQYKTIEPDIEKFIELFNEIIPKYPIAFSYLKEINDEKRFKTTNITLEEIKNNINTIHQEVFNTNERLTGLLPKENDVDLNIKEIANQFEIASEDLNNHKSYFGKNSNTSINRSIVNDIYNWIINDLKQSEEPLAVVSGNAGYGKSVIMKQLLKKLQISGHPTIALKADKLFINNINELKEEIGLSISIDEILRTLENNKLKSIFIIDQIDALSMSLSTDKKAINTYNRLINRVKKIDNVRIVISCRIYDLEHDPYLQQYNNLRKFIAEKLEISETKGVIKTLNIDESQFSEKFIEFLRIPIHLEIYSAIYNLIDKKKEFLSLQELYNEYWYQKIINSPIKSSKVIELIKKVTNEMFSMQKIIVTKRKYENQYNKEINYLTSEGVITSFENKIQFVHQSFFDYSNARCFVESGQKLTQIILHTEYHQGLFIRSGLRYVLLYLREYDTRLYYTELSTLLTDYKVRFHLKLLILNTLGFINEVNEYEKEIVKEIAGKDESLYRIFIESANSVDWQRELIQNHKVYEKLSYDDKNYSNCIYKLIIGTLETSVQLGLEALLNIPDFNNKSPFISRLLFFARYPKDIRFIKLFEEYFKQDNDPHGYFHFLENAAPYHPEWVISILKSNFKAPPSWEHKATDRDRYIYDVHKKLFEVNKTKAINYFVKTLLKIADKNKKAFEKSGIYDFFSGSQFFQYIPQKKDRNSHNIIFYMCNSVIEYLEDNLSLNKSHSLNIINQFHKTRSYVLHALTMPALIKYKGEFKSFVFEYLNNHQFFFKKHRDNEIFEYYFKEIIKEFYSVWSPEQIVQINNLILNAVTQNEVTKGEYYQSRVTKTGHNLYGITKFRLISMIPKEIRLSLPEINKEFKELSRKFSFSSNEKPKGISVTIGATGMDSNAYKYMTKEDWLKTFIKYQSNDTPPWEKGVDESEHRKKFEDSCSENPNKFIPILITAIETPKIPIGYITYGFTGLSKSNIDIEKLYSIFKILIEKRGKELRDHHLFMIVNSIDIFIEQDEIDPLIIKFICNTIENQKDDKLKETYSIAEGFVNSNRGVAILQLIYCYKFKRYENKIFSVLESLANKANEVTRAAVLYRLALLNNLNKDRTLQLFLKLNHDYNPDLLSIPLTEYHALYNIEERDFGSLTSFFEKAIEINESQTVMSHILFFAFLNGSNSSKKYLDTLLSKSEEVISTVIELAFANINDEQHFLKCNEVIAKYINHSSQEVHKTYENSFHYLSPRIFYKIYDFLKKYIKSPAGKEREHSFYHFLEKCLLENQNKETAEQIIELITEFNNHKKPDISLNTLSNEPLKLLIDAYSIIRDYSIKTGYLEIAMDIFDSMLSLPEYRGNMRGLIEKLDESIL